MYKTIKEIIENNSKYDGLNPIDALEGICKVRAAKQLDKDIFDLIDLRISEECHQEMNRSEYIAVRGEVRERYEADFIDRNFNKYYRITRYNISEELTTWLGPVLPVDFKVLPYEIEDVMSLNVINDVIDSMLYYSGINKKCKADWEHLMNTYGEEK